MAKLFHPDAHPNLFKGEVYTKVEDVFTKISEAYDVLSDNEKRRAYIDKISSKISDEDMEKANRAITAEFEFQKAEVILKRGGFQEAKAMLDQIVDLVPEEPEYQIYQAWATYKVEGPGKAQSAKKTIEKSMKERPKCKDGWYYLGMINRQEGDTEAAIKNFNKVIEMDRYNVDAQRELRVLTMRKGKGPEKKGLFGKKK
jgi:tetratricopeptide (TPR) repeat protein